MSVLLNDNIQKCTIDQVHILQKIAITTYQETFAATNSEALLQEYYKASLNISLLTKQLQNSQSEFYFIYSTPNNGEKLEVAGFLKLNINETQTDIFDRDALEIEKIYILKNHLKKGLGKQLIKFATQRATEQKKTYMWLGVWEKNYDAQHFYKKLGFTPFSQHDFDMGGEIQTDLLYKKSL